MPCDYRILQSSTKGQVLLILYETVQRAHKGRPLASLAIMRLGGCSSIRQRRI